MKQRSLMNPIMKQRLLMNPTPGTGIVLDDTPSYTHLYISIVSNVFICSFKQYISCLYFLNWAF